MQNNFDFFEVKRQNLAYVQSSVVRLKLKPYRGAHPFVDLG